MKARIIVPQNITDMNEASTIAENKRKLSGIKQMVLWDDRKECYRIRNYGKYTVNEELCYLTN